MPRADATYRAALRWRAFDTHGVTTADAADLDIPAVALRQLAGRGALLRVGQGVYRMLEVPPTPLSELAEAVALVGPGAVIADESVLAFHDLALVNPRRIRVVHPARSRATLPPTIAAERRQLAAADLTAVDGVPMMTVVAALLACRGRVMTSRLLGGIEDALSRALIDQHTAAHARRNQGTPQSSTTGADPTVDKVDALRQVQADHAG